MAAVESTEAFAEFLENLDYARRLIEGGGDRKSTRLNSSHK
jgi:hypothetical protein